jgi:hypothetical protein
MTGIIKPLGDSVTLQLPSAGIGNTCGNNKLILITSAAATSNLHFVNATPLSIIANTVGISNTLNVIKISGANSYVSVGYRVYYSVPPSNSAISGLSSNTIYFVSFTNSSSLAISATIGGANISLASVSTTDPAEVHKLYIISHSLAIVNTVPYFIEKEATESLITSACTGIYATPIAYKN